MHRWRWRDCSLARRAQHIAQTQCIASLRMLSGVHVIVYTKEASVRAQVEALNLDIEVRDECAAVLALAANTTTAALTPGV